MDDTPARRFRRRAADCRALAQSVADKRDSELLMDIAEELDAEAEKIERQEREGESSQ